jgi:hypothetical protein
MRSSRGRLIPGLILILLGIGFLLKEYFEIGPGLILLFFGAVFLLPYLFTRWYGMLVPGLLLTGLGIGMLFERGMRTDITAPLGLGLGFIAIFVVDFVATRVVRWWPLVPGVVLTFVGIVEAIPEANLWLQRGWPVLLIVLGLLVLATGFVRPRPETKDAGVQVSRR